MERDPPWGILCQHERLEFTIVIIVLVQLLTSSFITISCWLHIQKRIVLLIIFPFWYVLSCCKIKSLSGQRNLNEKKSRHASKESSSTGGEASYSFGNANELRTLHKQVLAENARPDDSTDFAPFILKDKYMTEKDACMKEIDMPERMQVYIVFVNGS